MALPNIRGFVTEEQNFPGIYQAGEIIQRNRYREEQKEREQQGRLAATNKFLTDYFDPKDRLTGTAYDPEIVRQLNDALIEGADLAKKGAGTSEIIMALGPKVGRISEYSQKAKLVNKAIGAAVSKLKPYKGYNTDALAEEAKKMAFYDENGKLKDITTVDPDKDWVTETVKTRPDLVTTGAGLDEFITKTPMRDYGDELQTMLAGVKRKLKYDAKSPFWMDVEKDAEGNAVTDKNGNPVGLSVKSEIWRDDKGQPLIDPDTKKPYRMLAKQEYNSIMAHNPDIADWVRGQVISTFRQMGDKVPAEDSPQWEGMARNILHDELKTRDKSFFKLKDLTDKSPIVTKIELGLPTQGGGSGSDANINKVYERIDSILNKDLEKGFNATRFNALDNDGQEIVKKAVENAGYKGSTGDDAESSIGEGGENIFLKKDDKGRIKVYRVAPDRKLISTPEYEITTLSYTGTNWTKQSGKAAKDETIQKGESGKAITLPPKTKRGRLD